uniref:type 2 lactosamine alpha-2,3-sialyltransferase-like isoform X2 n=1 Tax=Pristiophorus japonicus TaxID=55135 RepID=UPI00398F56AA
MELIGTLSTKTSELPAASNVALGLQGHNVARFHCLGSMKRHRCLKFLVVVVLFLFSYYLFYDKMKSSGSLILMQLAGVKKTEDDLTTGSKRKNPFLCSSDIGYKRWPAHKMTVPEILPFGTLSSERYFQAVLDNLKKCDLPNKLKNIPYLNCIVVGNGGILRNKTLGKKIDSYDVVIRINSGPVIGYEDDVGNKTTFRFCYPESVFSEHSQYDADTTLVFIPFKSVDLRWLKEVLLKKKVSMRGFWKKTPTQLIYKNSQIRILKPSMVQKAAFDLLNLPKVIPWPKPSQYPTTGIIAITMALSICDKVHIAGFKYDVYSPNSTLHYYGNDTMSAMEKMLYHNVTAEQMLLKKLKSSNTIFDLTGTF